MAMPSSFWNSGEVLIPETQSSDRSMAVSGHITQHVIMYALDREDIIQFFLDQNKNVTCRAFSRCFYPKRLTIRTRETQILSVLN